MQSQPKRILIVEDEKPLARVMSLKLNSAGYQTIVVFDGEQALAACSKEGFDLMILDLILPKKDGYFVLTEMKRLSIKMPVIVASNLGQKEDVEKARQLGAIDYFVKSDVTLEELVNRVKQYLQ